jgi:hypothetical protein
MKEEGIAGVKVSAFNSIGLRTILSRRHIQCALICAKESSKIEDHYRKENTWEMNAPFHQEEQAYACGAIISSIAYLESLINEFFNDCHYNIDHIKPLGPKTIQFLDTQNKKGFKCKRKDRKQSKIFCKYQTAYSIIKNKGIDTEQGLCQNLFDLIRLRNELVHYTPEFQFEEGDPYSLNHLQGRFSENIFMINTGNPFFPWKCLGSGCAKWAVETSIDFTDFFFNDIGFVDKLSGIRKMQSDLS